MTPKQKEVAAKKAANAKKRQKAKARKERKASLVVRRRERRMIRMAPKHRLTEWSLRVRAVGECEVCGATEHLQAHHLLPKERYQEFKFKKINGVCLCPTHHKMGKYSAHRNPVWFTVWLRTYRPNQYAWCLDNMGEDPNAPGLYTKNK